MVTDYRPYRHHTTQKNETFLIEFR